MVVSSFHRNLTIICVCFLFFLTPTPSIKNQHTTSTRQNKQKLDKVLQVIFGIDNNLRIYSNDDVEFVHNKQQSLGQIKHNIDTSQYYHHQTKQHGPEKDEVKMYNYYE